MLKHILAAAVATALITAPLAPAFAQATTEKSDKKAKEGGQEIGKEAHRAAAEDEGLRAEVGGLQEGKERQGPRRIPQVHEHLPEGLSASPLTAFAPPNAPRASTRLEVSSTPSAVYQSREVSGQLSINS